MTGRSGQLAASRARSSGELCRHGLCTAKGAGCIGPDSTQKAAAARSDGSETVTCQGASTNYSLPRRPSTLYGLNQIE